MAFEPAEPSEPSEGSDAKWTSDDEAALDQFAGETGSGSDPNQQRMHLLLDAYLASEPAAGKTTRQDQDFQAILATLSSSRRLRIVQRVVSQVSPPQSVLPTRHRIRSSKTGSRRTRRKRSGHFPAWIMSVAAVLVISLITWWNVRPLAPRKVPDVTTANNVTAVAKITPHYLQVPTGAYALRHGQTLTITKSMAIEPGDRSLSAEPGLTIAWPDGTEVTGEAGVEWTAIGQHGEFLLSAGQIVVSAAHQHAGTHLAFITSLAEIRVIGTRFQVTATPQSTVVSVTEGSVHVRRPSAPVDDPGAMLHAEQQATITNAQISMNNVRAISWTPESWAPGVSGSPLTVENFTDSTASRSLVLSGGHLGLPQPFAYIRMPMLVTGKEQTLALHLHAQVLSGHPDFFVQLKEDDGDIWVLGEIPLSDHAATWQSIALPVPTSAQQPHRTETGNGQWEPDHVRELLIGIAHGTATVRINGLQWHLDDTAD